MLFFPTAKPCAGKINKEISFLRVNCLHRAAVWAGARLTSLLIPLSPAGTVHWRPGRPGAHTVNAVLIYSKSITGADRFKPHT